MRIQRNQNKCRNCENKHGVVKRSSTFHSHQFSWLFNHYLRTLRPLRTALFYVFKASRTKLFLDVQWIQFYYHIFFLNFSTPNNTMLCLVPRICCIITPFFIQLFRFNRIDSFLKPQFIKLPLFLFTAHSPVGGYTMYCLKQYI